MSSLQQLVDRRRSESAAESHLCHTVEPQSAALVIVTATDEKWIFPWHQLTHAHLTRANDREQLALTFTSHVVTLRGRCFAPLADLVASLRLATVRPAPSKYGKSTDPEPFIDAITVAAHPDQKGAGAP
jgi:hypothetical protein